MSITLNIVEGTSRFSNADRRNFYTIARGSLYECIALMDLLIKDGLIYVALHLNFSTIGEEISKMLYSMEMKLTKSKGVVLYYRLNVYRQHVGKVI